MPPPRRIVLPVGSTCTTAGLVSGLALAHAIGAWRWPVPLVHAVRVTPWPVTARVVILRLAEATLARIASLGGPRITLSDPRLVVDRAEFGGGYGRVTDRGRDSIARFGALDAAPRLDGVYSAKAAAALLRLHREKLGPLLFWSTKSSVVMQSPTHDHLRVAPRALVRWLS
jgi:D-cysteine desulfhydrase